MKYGVLTFFINHEKKSVSNFLKLAYSELPKNNLIIFNVKISVRD